MAKKDQDRKEAWDEFNRERQRWVMQNTTPEQRLRWNLDLLEALARNEYIKPVGVVIPWDKLEPTTKALARAILEKHPEWQDRVEIVYLSNDENLYLRFTIPTPNPNVSDPLVIDTRPEISMHWHKAELHDFPIIEELGWNTDAVIGKVLSFLDSFLSERAMYKVVVDPATEGVLASKPIYSEVELAQTVCPPGSRTEIRSWLGTYDRDLLAATDAAQPPFSGETFYYREP